MLVIVDDDSVFHFVNSDAEQCHIWIFTAPRCFAAAIVDAKI